MLIIGICGASGSGKSTLAENISSQLEGRALVLPMDGYYFNQINKTMEQRARQNYDLPSSFDLDELYEDIQLLRAGYPITTKDYDFSVHLRADRQDLIQPPQVLIIEGIHAFADPRLLAIMDLKCYVDADADVCLLRRIKRDVSERGRDLQDVCRQYNESVKPALDNIISKYRTLCDICVVGGGRNETAAAMITAFVEKRLNESSKKSENDCIA